MTDLTTILSDAGEDTNEVLRIKQELHVAFETLVALMHREHQHSFNNETMLPVLLCGVLGSTIGLLLRDAPEEELTHMLRFVRDRIMESIEQQPNDIRPAQEENNGIDLETVKPMGHA